MSQKWLSTQEFSTKTLRAVLFKIIAPRTVLTLLTIHSHLVFFISRNVLTLQILKEQVEGLVMCFLPSNEFQEQVYIDFFKIRLILTAPV